METLLSSASRPWIILAIILCFGVLYLVNHTYDDYFDQSKRPDHPKQTKLSKKINDTVAPQRMSYSKIKNKTKVLEEIIDLSNFGSRCNPRQLFHLQRSNGSNATVLVPTSGKTDCPRYLAAGSSNLPFTALASFPGSGNTWMRHVLQQLTGIYTGAIYVDSTLKYHGFPYEGKLRNVIAVKTHGVIHNGEKLYTPIGKFDRVLIVVRNVYEAFLAQFKFGNFHDHTSNRYIDITSASWNSSFFKHVKWWETYISDIFGYTGPMLIVYYEDMKANLLPQLIRIADFLKTDEVKDFSFCCVVKEGEGQFHRKPAIQTIQDLFHREHRTIVNSMIDKTIKKLPQKYKELSERLNSYKLPL